MKAAQHDQCYGRRLARNGLRVTRSDHQPYPWERVVEYRARAAMVSADTFCTVAGVQPARVRLSPTGRAN